MIHNLEVERRRIEEALEVLRRLHQIRNATPTPDPREEQHHSSENADPPPAQMRAAKPSR